MRFLGVPLTPDGTRVTRPLKFVWQVLRRLHRYIRLSLVRDWAAATVILLVMQSIDQKISLIRGRSWIRGFRKSLQSAGGDIPCCFPIAQQAATFLAQEIDGEPINVIGEVLAHTPTTAHILGGCSMADSIETGVIDRNHEIFGHPGLFVVDGSAIPVNLGVNPSLTISALAERFASFWPYAPGFSEQQKRELEVL